jgi:protein involved in polysaccharide export with SLBB domain
MLTYLRFTVLLSGAILTLACGSTGREGLPPTPAGSEQDEYRILAGDLLAVQFFFDEQLNQQVLVRTDGGISLHLVQEVDAAGSTPAELALLLEQRYAEFVEVPYVSVNVLESAQRVYVLGEVRKPGEVPWSSALTVLQAAARVGGFTDRADLEEVIVIRRINGERYTTKLDLTAALADPAEDVQLEPDDTLFIPLTGVARVNRWVDQYIRRNLPIPVRATVYDD